MLAAAAVAAPEPHLKREAEAVAEAEADPEPFYAGLPTIASVAPFAHAPVAHGLGYAGGSITSHVPTACTPSTEEIEIQSCAPTSDKICKTEDVASQEITYEKRCKEVINKQCAHIGHSGLIIKREAEAVAEAVAEAEADPEPFYAGLPTIAGVAPFAHAPVAHAAPVVAPVAHSIPQAVTKKIEAPCTEVVTEHCVDVPIVKEVVTPVETCHVVTKVTCTPAVHSIPKVTCEPGTAEIVHHVPGYAHLG